MEFGPDKIAALPSMMQYALAAGLFFGGLIAAYFGYFGKRKLPPQTATEMILSAGSIADMGPVREAATALKNIEKILGKFLDNENDPDRAVERANYQHDVRHMRIAAEEICDMLKENDIYRRAFRDGQQHGQK